MAFPIFNYMAILWSLIDNVPQATILLWPSETLKQSVITEV